MAAFGMVVQNIVGCQKATVLIGNRKSLLTKSATGWLREHSALVAGRCCGFGNMSLRKGTRRNCSSGFSGRCHEKQGRVSCLLRADLSRSFPSCPDRRGRAVLHYQRQSAFISGQESLRPLRLGVFALKCFRVFRGARSNSTPLLASGQSTNLLGAPASRRPVGSRKPELAGGTPALPGTAPRSRRRGLSEISVRH